MPGTRCTTLSLGLFSASFDGLLFKLLPGHVALESAGIYLLMYLSCLVSIQFSRGYLYTRPRLPLPPDRFLRGLLLACVALLASEPLGGPRAWNVLASLTVMLVSLSLLLAGVHVWRQGLRYGLYHILACRRACAVVPGHHRRLAGLRTVRPVRQQRGQDRHDRGTGDPVHRPPADRINALKEEGFRCARRPSRRGWRTRRRAASWRR
ncbi:7TM diverse intracellular signaling domain-containing protein [Pseudomonas aeruginosa]